MLDLLRVLNPCICLCVRLNSRMAIGVTTSTTITSSAVMIRNPCHRPYHRNKWGSLIGNLCLAGYSFQIRYFKAYHILCLGRRPMLLILHLVCFFTFYHSYTQWAESLHFFARWAGSRPLNNFISVKHINEQWIRFNLGILRLELRFNPNPY